MATYKPAYWFVQEIVIGFGFFTGLWLFVGFDPEGLVVNTLLDVLGTFSSSMASTLGVVYWLLGAVFVIISIITAYGIGKWAGLLAVFLAFLGGLFITSIGVWLFVFGVFLGFLAPFLRGNNPD